MLIWTVSPSPVTSPSSVAIPAQLLTSWASKSVSPSDTETGGSCSLSPSYEHKPPTVLFTCITCSTQDSHWQKSSKKSSKIKTVTNLSICTYRIYRYLQWCLKMANTHVLLCILFICVIWLWFQWAVWVVPVLSNTWLMCVGQGNRSS